MNEFLIMGDTPGSAIPRGNKISLFLTKTIKTYQSVRGCQPVRDTIYYPGNSVGFNKNFSRNLISSIPDIKMLGSV